MGYNVSPWLNIGKAGDIFSMIVKICNMFKYKGKVMSCKLFTSIDHMTPVGS